MHPESHACHAKRMSQRVKSRVHATRPERNPHGTAPPARPPSTLPARSNTHDPRSLPREKHVRRACTKHAPNPIPMAQRRQHARGMPAACLQHARSPQPATRTRQECARRHTRTLAMHAAPHRERRSEPDSRTEPRFRKPRRCHPAALIEEFRRLGAGERFGSKILEYHDMT